MHGARGSLAWVVVLGALLFVVAAGTGAGCATSTTDTEAHGAGAASPSSNNSTGPTGGAGGVMLPCGLDCSTIQAPPCHRAQCNTTTRQCEIVPEDDGTACDDGMFCTTGDACQAGMCEGGPANTCGIMQIPCQQITCNEDTDACSQTPSMDGASCQNANLCITGSICTNGLCLGGVPTDCFFFPVPDDCHVAQCNQTNGLCESVVGNEGQTCIDSDLCTLGKTCSMGMCQGGMPKDCSALTMGCFNGVCNTANGQCIQQAVMPGQMCAAATDDCNVGYCDTMGNCIPMPANQGMMCNDNNPCTSGTTCNNGVCTGGTTITACTGGDSCCPMGCTVLNDPDCGCSINPAIFPLLITGSTVGVGQVAFDPSCNLLVVHGNPRNLVRVNGGNGSQTVVAANIGAGSYALGVTYRPVDGLNYVSLDSGQVLSVTNGGMTNLIYDHTSEVEALAIAPSTFGAFGGQIIGTTQTGQVLAINPSGPTVTVVGMDTGTLSSLVFSASGTLYVVNYTQGRVSSVTSSGVFTTVSTLGFAGDGIAIDNAGNRLFVSRESNDQLYQVPLMTGIPALIGSFDFDSTWFVSALVYDGQRLLMGTGESSQTLLVTTP